MKNIVILSADTAHHRYFINSLLGEGIRIGCCLFETEHVQAPFPTGPLFEEEEARWEAENFFETVPKALPSGLALHVDTVNSADSMERLQEIDADFGIVFGTGKIASEVIGLFRDGLINVHRGIAEKYRGLDSDLWAIYHRDYESIGVTIHRVAPLLDAGDIVFQRRLIPRRGMMTHQIRYYTTLIATELVVWATRDYLTGHLRHEPQTYLARYYSFMPLDLKK
ncbi:MAG: formyl transferase, partial [Planctomycetes bacterium]|nr:formyl transferase [Planctomycetota bacterium]